MLKLVCLALCVAAAAAQGCCGPARWEGDLEATSGLTAPEVPPKSHLERASVHYDSQAKKVAALYKRYDVGSDMGKTVWILEDFNTMRRMEVQDGACTITELTGEMRGSCTPPDAVYLRDYYVGVTGGSLELNVYDVPMERSSDSFHLRMTKNCIPFSIRVVEIAEDPTAGLSSAWYSTYHGIREGIEDESVFDTPQECQHLDVNPKMLRKSDGKDIISVNFHKN